MLLLSTVSRMDRKTDLRPHRTAANARPTANRSEYTFSKLNSSLSPICISYFHSSLLSTISTRILTYIHLCYLTRLLNAAGAFFQFHSNLPATFLSFPNPFLSVLGVTQSSNTSSSLASTDPPFHSFKSFLSSTRESPLDLLTRLPFGAEMLASSLRMAKSITKYLLWRPLKLTIHLKRMVAVFLKYLETNLIKKPDDKAAHCKAGSTSALLGSSFRAPSFVLSLLLLFILIRKCK